MSYFLILFAFSGNHERDWPGSGSFYGNLDSGGECGVLAQTMFYVPADNRAKFWYETMARLLGFSLKILCCNYMLITLGTCTNTNLVSYICNARSRLSKIISTTDECFFTIMMHYYFPHCSQFHAFQKLRITTDHLFHHRKFSVLSLM